MAQLLSWVPVMPPRSPGETHRAATPLELFFDLVFVVAVAQAAANLHHEIAAGHAAQGIFAYGMVFFAIWWAWMNFTWFASAYDTDDVPYRLVVFVQITGALIMAAGTTDAFGGDWRLVTYGFVVMRLALVFQWVRAAVHHPEGRRAALRYASGVAVLQVGWVLLLRVPAYATLGFFGLAFLEILVPIWASAAARLHFHAEHVVERYGLFTIIVLGESILAATLAIDAAADSPGVLTELLPLIGGGLLVVFSLWWLYFGRPMTDRLVGMRSGFAWGYGHYFVFGSGAAVGAGIAVLVDVETAHSEIGLTAAGFALAVPVAVFLMSLWALHLRSTNTAIENTVLPLTAALVLATPFTPEPALAGGAVVAAALALKLYAHSRSRGATAG
jgi:low temperature requirement protein LtrA